MELVKIPAERVRVLRGNADETRKMLEEKLKVRISTGSEGEVELNGESIDEFFAKDIIRAIGRGFGINTALKLLEEEYALRIINLREFGRSKKDIIRIKGRIIGERGRTKKIIEEIAEAELSIYGHTVGIIATVETIEIAVNAVSKLIEGAKHSAVYSYLERARRKLKEERARNMF